MLIFDHIVIAMATHRLTQEGKRVGTQFAELLSQGKDRLAYAAVMEAMYPKGIARGLASTCGPRQVV